MKLQLGHIPELSREEYDKAERLGSWKQNENRCKEMMGKAVRTEPVH